MINLSYQPLDWPLKVAFKTSRNSRTSIPCLYVSLDNAEGYRGHGEAVGVHYKGETPETMAAQIEGLRNHIETGISRFKLLKLLPAGGARNALDSALWDLEAKTLGIPAWQIAGLDEVHSFVTAETIGLRSLEGYRERARELAHMPLIKLKADGVNDLENFWAVREAAPYPRLIIDANEAWTIKTLQKFLPDLLSIGIEMIEQPLPAEDDSALEGFNSPIPLCADESLRDKNDVGNIAGKYQVANIKLDKTGGLTAALELARELKPANIKIMTGCMAGSSLANAPAAIIAQMSAFVDLDGPLLHSEDHAFPMTHTGNIMDFPRRELWG